MNLITQAEQRRNNIYNDFSREKARYNLIFINSAALGKKYNVSRNTILADIKYFLANNWIKPFMLEAHIYELLPKKTKIISTELNNNLNTSTEVSYIKPKLNVPTIHDLNFSNEEKIALQEFEQHRKDINKPLSSLAYEKMIARAYYLKNKGVDLVKHINYSISGGKDQIYETIYEKEQNNNAQLTFKERDEINRRKQLKQTRETQAAIHNFLNGNDEQDNKLLGNTNK